MRERFAGVMSEAVLAQGIEDYVEVYSNDEGVLFDRTPARVRRYLTHFVYV